MAPRIGKGPVPVSGLLGCVLAAFVLLGAAPSRGDEAAALRAVEAFRDRMAVVAEGPAGDRLEGATAVVDDLLDLPGMVRNAVGTLRMDGWSADERQTALGAFRRYTAAVLAERVADTDFAALIPYGTRPGPGGSTIVDATLGGDELSFVVVRDDGGWRLMDVVREGVSELALRRAEFAAAAGEGASVLAARLDARAAELAGSLP